MTTQEVANRLYELCNKGEQGAAQKELFAETATSTESNMKGEIETVHGMEAIKEKGKKFQSMLIEMHGGHIKEPVVFGNHILWKWVWMQP